jgi:putative membrane protein
MPTNRRSKVAAVVLTAAGAALAASQPTAFSSAAAATQAAPTVSAQDRMYLHDSLHGDRFEVRGGRLAHRKSDRVAVRRFGARMVRDHRMSYAEARQTAQEVGVAAPSRPSAGQRRVVALWRTLPERSFNCAYITYEWVDHQLDIADAQDEIKDGTNPSVVAHARKDLPILQAHLRFATRILHHMRGC